MDAAKGAEGVHRLIRASSFMGSASEKFRLTAVLVSSLPHTLTFLAWYKSAGPHATGIESRGKKRLMSSRADCKLSWQEVTRYCLSY